ncbi:MAG: non-ribosomal peptide synthetase, partial [bacterium]|nr:non-ribosomal peptide synthetase [bacterium]
RESVIPGVTVARTVGWFTAFYPVILTLSTPENISRVIREVKENLHKVPKKGIGYGILRYLTPTEKRKGMAFTQKPQINFNYLGQYDENTEEEGGIRISAMDTGKAVSPELESLYSLDINGITTGGRLNLDIAYSKKEYRREEIETLARNYRETLQEIIVHCKAEKETTLTPSDLTLSGMTMTELEGLEHRYTLEKKQIVDIYPLSTMQENMLFHALSSMETAVPTESSAAYFEQMSLELRGQVQLTLLEKTFNKLVEKYDVLRTVFLYQTKGRPAQVLLKEFTNVIHYEDLTRIGAGEAKKAVEQFKKDDREAGFDLTIGPLMRIALFRTTETTATIIWSFHHILMDGWCIGILFNDFMDIYRSLKQDEPVTEKPVVPYVRYIRWLERQDRKKGLDYWARYLEDYEQQTTVPKQTKAAPGDYRLQKAGLQIDGQTTRRLNSLAADKQVTLNTLFQTLWGLLLQKYNNTNDVVFGAVVSGRPPQLEGVAGMVGLFINTVPVRIKQKQQNKTQEGKEKPETFTTLITGVQQHSLETRSFEYLSLAEIQAQSYMKDKLIDHIFVFENFPVQENIEGAETKNDAGFEVTAMEMFEQTNYDFNIMAAPTQKELKIQIIYNAAVYEPAFINSLLNHLKTIIQQTAANPGIETATIEMLTLKEKQQLLLDFNDSHQEYPREKTIHQLFEEQVERTPDSISLVGSEKPVGSWQLPVANEKIKDKKEIKEQLPQME